MLMLAALIYVKSCQSLASESVVGDHTLYGGDDDLMRHVATNLIE